MAPRAFWTGHLRLSLVNIPVKLYPATTAERSIAFHQIHEPTGKRIRYQKIAPGVGPVENDGFLTDGGQLEVAPGVGADGDRPGCAAERQRALRERRHGRIGAPHPGVQLAGSRCGGENAALG